MSPKDLTAIYRLLWKQYGPQHWWPAETPFEVIVGAILTQNTAWKNVETAIQGLKKKRLLSPRKMTEVSSSVLARVIRPAGYFNVKARRLKHFLLFLRQRYKGDLKTLLKRSIGPLREALLSVNGIGPETADSIVLYAAHKPIFVVDAYTRRIFSRLGFLGGEESYGEIQAVFMKALPKQTTLFNEYHALIVAHGKNTCAARHPRCSRCSLERLCEYAEGRRPS
ncbi:MAG: hypothetical protein HYZ87_00335 [Candidatus Omnitrophica bacterium]|nr:hypothetical protein [Candidatus Omnitrophota bacterium]